MVKSSEKITLAEGEKIINEFKENAEILNTFFSNAVKNLKIPEYQQTDPLANNISHPIFKVNLKYRNHQFGNYIYDFFNFFVDRGDFLSVLKIANITPVFRKGDRDLKDNYRPVSILPVISKIFEKLLYKQVTMFIDPLLSKFQCRFRKSYGAQECLLAMLEHWKSAADKGKIFGALLTDLSKAFDCLSHELIISKLNA